MPHETITRKAARPPLPPWIGDPTYWLVPVFSPDPQLVAGGPVEIPVRLELCRRGSASGAERRSGRYFICDPLVSHTHAAINGIPGDLPVLRDLGSSNGTLINGRRVTVAHLSPGDVLRVGDTLFVVCTSVADSNARKKMSSWMVGRSAALLRAWEAIVRVAGKDVSVLISGETGTGKELVASALHGLSGRGGRFLGVNTAAIPQTLFESELFGVQKGAFSGASESRPGYFCQADHGTLFLDEVGDMPLELQAKLLRVMETREVTPLGATRPVLVDVRVVAATNADLQARMSAGTFRPDLFFRLAQFRIDLAPLRRRREDVLPIWDALLERRAGPGARPLEANGAEALLLYDWPGNVREVAAAVIHFHAAGGQAHSTETPLPEPITKVYFERTRAAAAPAMPEADSAAPPMPASAPEPFRYAGPQERRPSKAALEDALLRHQGNIAAVAAEFHCHRQQVYRWMKSYGIARPPGGTEGSADSH